MKKRFQMLHEVRLWPMAGALTCCRSNASDWSQIDPKLPSGAYDRAVLLYDALTPESRYRNLWNMPSGTQSIFSPSAVTTGVQRATSSASIRRKFSGLESGVGSIPASINICW